MKCPFCQSEDNRVIDTRKFDTCIIRIRLCINCKVAWHTQETVGATDVTKLVERHIKLEIHS